MEGQKEAEAEEAHQAEQNSRPKKERRIDELLSLERQARGTLLTDEQNRRALHLSPMLQVGSQLALRDEMFRLMRGRVYQPEEESSRFQQQEGRSTDNTVVAQNTSPSRSRQEKDVVGMEEVVEVSAGGAVSARDVRRFLRSAGGTRCLATPTNSAVPTGSRGSRSGGPSSSSQDVVPPSSVSHHQPSPPRHLQKNPFVAASRSAGLPQEEKYVQTATAGSVKKLRELTARKHHGEGSTVM